MKAPRIAIIGGGPGGAAAAVQLKRYGFDPLLFEPGKIGGLLHNAWRVENYPGFPEGINGAGLAYLIEKQVQTFDITIKKESVIHVDYYDSVKKFELRTEDSSFSPDYLIVASGTTPQFPASVENISQKSKEKVYYEVQPLLNVNNKRIAVLGAGDAAFDYSMNLAQNNEVIILNRTDKISALPLLQKFVEKTEAITYCENVEIVLMRYNSRGKLAITMAKFDETWLLEVDYLVVAIGRVQNKSFYAEKLLKRESSLIGNGRLYLVGDVRNGIFRQTAIAAGDGVRAAMDIYNRIMEND